MNSITLLLIAAKYNDQEVLHPREIEKYLASMGNSKKLEFPKKYSASIFDPFYLENKKMELHKCLACNIPIYGNILCYGAHRRSKLHLENVKKFNNKF